MKILTVTTLAILVSTGPLLAQNQGNNRRQGQGFGRAQNAISLLLEKHQQLELTDQQIERLEVVRTNLDEANEPHIAQMRGMRGSGGRPDPSVRERMRPHFEALRQNREAAFEATMGILEDGQRGTAREIMEGARPRRSDNRPSGRERNRRP